MDNPNDHIDPAKGRLASVEPSSAETVVQAEEYAATPNIASHNDEAMDQNSFLDDSS